LGCGNSLIIQSFNTSSGAKDRQYPYWKTVNLMINPSMKSSEHHPIV
jgi:hypothetical protein